MTKHQNTDTLPSSDLTGRITTIIETARNRVRTVIDSEMVRAYWEIGREIVEDEQHGENRAGYGEYLIKKLAQELTDRYGKGFDYSNLKNMRQLYNAYPISDALRSQLSWTHYRLLMRHNGEALTGNIPLSKLRLVQAWIEIHKDDLMTDWRLAVSSQNPLPIKPLE